MFVVWCFGVRCVLFVVRCVLFVIRCLCVCVLVAHCPPFVVCVRLLFGFVVCALVVVRCSLCVVRCALRVVCCVLRAAYCVCCVLCVACSLLLNVVRGLFCVA